MPGITSSASPLWHGPSVPRSGSQSRDQNPIHLLQLVLNSGTPHPTWRGARSIGSDVTVLCLCCACAVTVLWLCCGCAVADGVHGRQARGQGHGEQTTHATARHPAVGVRDNEPGLPGVRAWCSVLGAVLHVPCAVCCSPPSPPPLPRRCSSFSFLSETGLWCVRAGGWWWPAW